LKRLVAEQQITLDATDEAIEYLANRGYDPQYGARPIKRVIQKEVLNSISKELLSGRIQAGSIVLIDSFNDELVFRNEGQLAK
jgi:ATP-dependent Clp protease ATP-binding subunit ClpB